MAMDKVLTAEVRSSMSHKGGRDASFVAGPSGDHKGESDDEKCGAAAAVGPVHARRQRAGAGKGAGSGR